LRAAVSQTDTGAPAGGGRRGWLRWVRLALIAVLVGFAGWAIAKNWSAVAVALTQIPPWAVVVAFVPGYLAMGTAVFVWRALMTDLGQHLTVRQAARIFYPSQLGKYVPGSVWSIATQIELSREHNIPKRTNVTTGVLAIAISITSGLSLAAVMLALTGGTALHHYWWILLVIPLFLVALHPRVLGNALNLVLRLVRREPLPRTPTWAGLGRVAALQTLLWVLMGLQAWVLLVGFGAPALRSLPVAIGGYALAYALGQLAVGLPAGAGVRDAALTLALSTVVATPTALVVALLSRVILTVVDLTMAGAQLLALRRARPAPRSPGLPASKGPLP
jgi:glycosyltransferase 2 family protein